MKIASFSRLYILMLLSTAPRHGYEIMKELEAGIGKKPSAADVYPFLKKLMGQKYVYVKIESTGNRALKSYVFTAKGRKLTKQVLESLTTIIEAMVASKVTVCTHCNCRIYGEAYFTPRTPLKNQKRNQKIARFCCKYCAQAAAKWEKRQREEKRPG